MKDFKDFLTEGVYDKHIFKAFWLAGGPGSGKSWVAKRPLEGSGMKVINTDKGLKRYSKQAGLDLTKMNTFTDKEMKLKDYFRAKSKKGTVSQLQHAIDGRLGLILDSTGRNTDRIEDEARAMSHIGYNTFLIFVNTTLEVALKRNQYFSRGRPLPDSIVISNWKQVQANKKKLQNIFGAGNYVEVDNNEDLPHINSQVYKAINKLKRNPVNHHLATSWIANELAMKKYAGTQPGKSPKAGLWSRFKSMFA